MNRESHQKQCELREYMQTDEFKQLYKNRAGIEGTISQAVRKIGFRKSKYVGLAKTHLQEVLKSTALNLYQLRISFRLF